MKKFLPVVTLILFQLNYGQVGKDFSLLENTYRYEYNEVSQILKIIKIESDNSYIVNQRNIAPDSFSGFSQYIRTHFEDQEYRFLKSTFKFKNLDDNGTSLASAIVSNDITFINGQDPLDEGKINIEGLPESFQEFEIIKNPATNNYELKNPTLFKTPVALSDASAITVANEVAILLNNNIKTVVAKLKSEFEIYLKEFDKFHKNTILKVRGYSFLTMQDFEVSGNSKSYNVFIMDKGKTLSLKLCEVLNGDSCSNVGIYNYSISEKEFENNFYKNYLNQNFDKSAVNNVVIDNILKLIRKEKEQIEIQKEKEELSKSLELVAEKLDNEQNRYAGRIVLNKEFNLYECKINEKGDTVAGKKIEDVFLVDNANISFFNNRIDEISIEGRLRSNPTKTIRLENDEYSLTFKNFKERSSTDGYTNNQLEICGRFFYDDILDFLSLKEGGKFSKAIKNSQIRVEPEEDAKVKARNISDYFTGVIFSDVLGLNPNNSNSLLIAEGIVRVPLNRRSSRYFTLLDNITLYGAVNIVGNLDNTARKIELESITSENPEDFDETKELFSTNNFNLFTNYNATLGLNTSILTFEIKRAKTFAHLRYGFQFLRTRVEYNLLDEDITMDNGTTTIETTVFDERAFQVYSIGQEVDINFEIRPQAEWFGADLSLGVNWFGETGVNKNDINFRATNNTPNYKLMTTIYAFTNSDKSNNGFFVRLGGYYNLGDYELFPQFMVGYATNLTSFINKVKK